MTLLEPNVHGAKLLILHNFNFLKRIYAVSSGKGLHWPFTGNFTEVNPLRRIATQTSRFVTCFWVCLEWQCNIILTFGNWAKCPSSRDALVPRTRICSSSEKWRRNWINTGRLSLNAVSYTHLRAHETPEHLVCRLLLEKKKQSRLSTGKSPALSKVNQYLPRW